MTTRTQLVTRMCAQAAHVIDGYRDEFLRDNSSAADPEGLWDGWREGENRRRATAITDWAASVPPLWYAADLDRLSDTQQPEKIRGYLTGDLRNLILAGPVGTGKSFAAWAIAHQAVTHGMRPKGWSTPRLLLDMRPDGDRTAFDRACMADLLILDDLGAARPTDWATEQIYSIAEARTNHQLRTVITTNSSWDELVAIWGAPTMDRFRDRATSVALRGDSRRGAA